MKDKDVSQTREKIEMIMEEMFHKIESHNGSNIFGLKISTWKKRFALIGAIAGKLDAIQQKPDTNPM